MTSRGRQTLTLELELSDSDAIAGRLTDQLGRSSDFVGWLGLAGAIESLTATATPRNATWDLH